LGLKEGRKLGNWGFPNNGSFNCLKPEGSPKEENVAFLCKKGERAGDYRYPLRSGI